MKNKNKKMIFIIIFGIIIVGFIIFVLFKPEYNVINNYKITKCTLDNDQSKSDYKSITNYTIYSKNNVVKKVISKEVLTSKNTTIIMYFTDLLEKQYKSENDKYGGFSYDVSSKGDKVVSNVTIDYSKMDLDKYIKDNTAMKSYVNNDNNVTLSGIKTMYESLGAKCE